MKIMIILLHPLSRINQRFKHISRKSRNNTIISESIFSRCFFKLLTYTPHIFYLTKTWIFLYFTRARAKQSTFNFSPFKNLFAQVFEKYKNQKKYNRLRYTAGFISDIWIIISVPEEVEKFN